MGDPHPKPLDTLILGNVFHHCSFAGQIAWMLDKLILIIYVVFLCLFKSSIISNLFIGVSMLLFMCPRSKLSEYCLRLLSLWSFHALSYPILDGEKNNKKLVMLGLMNLRAHLIWKSVLEKWKFLVRSGWQNVGQKETCMLPPAWTCPILVCIQFLELAVFGNFACFALV